MATNGSGEISSGTGWKCQAMRHFEGFPEYTPQSNRDDNNCYYRCNLGKVMDECEETYSRPARWNFQTTKNYLSSNTSMTVQPSIDDAFNAIFNDGSSFMDAIKIIGDVIELRYDGIKNLASSAINDIRRLWSTTDGTYFHRAKVVNKLVGYYLISLAIYIIEISFWINRRLFHLLVNLVLEQKDHTRVLTALCIVAVFVFLIYLLGGEGTLFATSICES